MCGLPGTRHKKRSATALQARKLANVNKQRNAAREKSKYKGPKTPATEFRFIGIDGEGQTVNRSAYHSGEHRYTFLAAASETGVHWSIENANGLSTAACLDFILDAIPHNRSKIFAYSFGYDLTKALVDLSDEQLYLLFRPEERPGIPRKGRRSGPRPILWKNYRLNMQGSKFTVGRGKKEVVLWDIFKFYQSKFVGALKDWKVGVDGGNTAKYIKPSKAEICECCGTKGLTLILNNVKSWLLESESPQAGQASPAGRLDESRIIASGNSATVLNESALSTATLSDSEGIAKPVQAQIALKTSTQPPAPSSPTAGGPARIGQVSFCVACSVKTLPLVERMQLMKDQRHVFDQMPLKEVRAYCFEECVCMAKLARKLVEAHEACGLKLKTFYGAGSSATAMLTVMKIKEKNVKPPEAMRQLLAQAFFGGRFENSVIGQIAGPVYNYDISSAYPYQIVFLPCLEHGLWVHSTKREELEKGVRSAFVRYTLGNAPHSGMFEEHWKRESPLPQPVGNPRHAVGSWGPFPFRTEDGSISFPIESGGGWVGREEYLWGERLFPHVHFLESWLYKCDCDCQPFALIAEFYKERIRIGKEGPGIVLKLGYNANYGKIAQSVGSAVFSNWIWASLITSGCRAQMLELLGLHKDWRNLLMIATDGAYTREKIECPVPLDTGTWKLPSPDGIAKKPLGGWEEKRIDKGVFVARPGIYFPMNPTDAELKDVRGRGVGKGVVLENWRKIVDHWNHYKLRIDPETDKTYPCVVSNVSRFCGAKSSLSRSVKKLHADGTIDYNYNRADGTGECALGCAHHNCGHVPSYGQWITRPVEMSFHPRPKRDSLREDGLTLELRRFSQDLESVPYDKAIKSQERLELEAAMAELLEQPESDLSDYEFSEEGD